MEPCIWNCMDGFMFVRGYLRASTKEQNANRAKDDLTKFAHERNFQIASFYTENESGASLERPELFRLLNECHPNDVLLIENVDRLSRLNASDWETLKTEIKKRQIRVVALDLPTSWVCLSNTSDGFTDRLFEAINAMILDMLAAFSRKDYEDRIKRQKQGIQVAKAKGLYKGRPANNLRNNEILKMLSDGYSWNSIINLTGCSRSTISRLKNNSDSFP